MDDSGDAARANAFGDVAPRRSALRRLVAAGAGMLAAAGLGARAAATPPPAKKRKRTAQAILTSVVASGHTTTQVIVDCPPGLAVQGGGFSFETTALSVQKSQPNLASPVGQPPVAATAWEVNVFNSDAVAHDAVAYVICQ